MNKRSFLFSIIGLLALGGAATALATATSAPRAVIGSCNTGCETTSCCSDGDCCCPGDECCCDSQDCCEGAEGACCVAPSACC